MDENEKIEVSLKDDCVERILSTDDPEKYQKYVEAYCKLSAQELENEKFRHSKEIDAKKESMDLGKAMDISLKVLGLAIPVALELLRFNFYGKQMSKCIEFEQTGTWTTTPGRTLSGSLTRPQ